MASKPGYDFIQDEGNAMLSQFTRTIKRLQVSKLARMWKGKLGRAPSGELDFPAQQLEASRQMLGDQLHPWLVGACGDFVESRVAGGQAE